MPRRAISSSLFLLLGILSGYAAPLDPGTRNAGLHPRSTLKVAILKPADAGISVSGQRLVDTNIHRIVPVWRTPVAVKVGRMTFNQSDGAVVRPVVTKAAGGS